MRAAKSLARIVELMIRPSSARAYLAGEVRHGVVGQLVGSARETTAPEQELQQRREPQPRRAGLVAQQIQLVADQREVFDDLIQSQVAPHLRGSPGRSGLWGSFFPSDRACLTSEVTCD